MKYQYLVSAAIAVCIPLLFAVPGLAVTAQFEFDAAVDTMYIDVGEPVLKVNSIRFTCNVSVVQAILACGSADAPYNAPWCVLYKLPLDYYYALVNSNFLWTGDTELIAVLNNTHVTGLLGDGTGVFTRSTTYNEEVGGCNPNWSSVWPLFSGSIEFTSPTIVTIEYETDVAVRSENWGALKARYR